MPSVKEIYHKIDDVRIEADSINLNVDGLEALAATQQADVAAIKADLADGIPVSVSSSTLPTGAATSANQATANTSLSSIDGKVPSGLTVTSSRLQVDSNSSLRDGSGNSITSTAFGLTRRLDVNLSSAGTVGSAAPTSANLYAGSDGTNLRAVSVDSTGKLNTNVIPPSGTITTRSGTITTGGTSQQVAASNSFRKYFAIQNISDTAMYLGVGYTPTSTTGILLTANGGGFAFESNFIPTQAINILCATTGKAFVAWEG